MSKIKKIYMERALTLALKGCGWVSPNPMVGAVIVKNNKIIAEGYHRKYGDIHAEIDALNLAEKAAKNSTVYVNLEPCSHFGYNPPCVDAIISAGIRKVVIAMQDPNPLVSGRGITKLKENGVEVELGVLADEAKKINEVFIKYITSKKPFIAIKTAITLDGKIATSQGVSKWITGQESRDYVHNLRHKYDAVLVGINTVLKDDPQLNCRLKIQKKDPVRIVIDSGLRIPLSAKVINSSKEAPLMVFTKNNEKKKVKELERLGAIVLIEEGTGRVSLDFVINKLSEMHVASVLVEGGAEITWSFIKQDLVDKFYTFIAPKLLGGNDSIPFTGGDGIREIEKAKKVKWEEIKYIGDDILIISYKG